MSIEHSLQQIYDLVARFESQGIRAQTRIDEALSFVQAWPGAATAQHAAALADLGQSIEAATNGAIPPMRLLDDEPRDQMTAIIRKIAELTLQIEKLELSAGAVAASFNSAVETLSSARDVAIAAVEDWGKALTDEISQTTGFLEGAATAELDSTIDALSELDEHIQGEVEVELLAACNDTIGMAEEACRQSLANLAVRLGSSANLLRDSLVNRVHELDEAARERVTRALERQFSDLGDRAINTLVDDVAENMILTQMCTTMTSALSPFLPQIIVARKVLDQVRHLLDILRMGV